MELLREQADLLPTSVVADIGSGTGKLTEMLLRNGNAVLGVEPNREMRRAAERALGAERGFRSVCGTAETTGLEPASVDHIVAAQAFHWFRLEPALREFRRIGRPAAWTALIWNRRLATSAFLRAYESLLKRLSIDYGKVDHRDTTDSGAIGDFFGAGGHRRTSLPHGQVLDWEGLLGRALSSSYVPLPGQAGYQAVLTELRRAFDEHQQNGRVEIEYETEVFWGRLTPG